MGPKLKEYPANSYKRRFQPHWSEHLLDFLSKYSPELQSHILHSPRNARYLSPQIQNELIAINGDMIRNSIVDECNSSSFWSVMADETTDVSTKEQVSVCVRYIRKTHPHGLEVCEEFLCRLQMQKQSYLPLLA